MNGLIKRKDLYDSIEIKSLFSLLSSDDIKECGLDVNEGDSLHLTDKQHGIASALCIAFKRYIEHFPEITGDEILCAQEVSELLGVTRQHVARLKTDGLLKSFKEIPNGTLFLKDDVYDYITSKRGVGPAFASVKEENKQLRAENERLKAKLTALKGESVL